jgi:hypothetical protein
MDPIAQAENRRSTVFPERRRREEKPPPRKNPGNEDDDLSLEEETPHDVDELA